MMLKHLLANVVLASVEVIKSQVNVAQKKVPKNALLTTVVNVVHKNKALSKMTPVIFKTS